MAGPRIDISKPSPHQSSRNGMQITCVVIHYTGATSLEGSVQWALDPASKASWHFVIGRDGAISQQVDLPKAAWHAGEAQAPYMGKPSRYVNSFSIGIELCNLGQLVRKDARVFHQGEPGKLTPYTGPMPFECDLIFPARYVGEPIKTVPGPWEVYPEAQVQALDGLLRYLRMLGYTTACDNLLGHNEVATPAGRKVDPGPAFPWERFRAVDPGLAVRSVRPPQRLA